MRLQTRLTQRQEQRLLPQMLQSIEILQLATTDLLSLVAQELQDNEVLELVAAADPSPGASARELPLPDASLRSRSANEDDGKRLLLENQPAPGQDLVAFVRQQVLWLDLPPRLGELVLLLASHLDERGWLGAGVEELAAGFGCSASELDDALAVLQTLEPRGIGARSAVESMLLQAVGDPDFATIRRLLTEHLDDLARNRLPEVARALQWSIEDLTALLDRMRSLQPRPATAFMSPAADPLRVDLVVELIGDDVVVAPASGALPELAISSSYEALLRDASLDRSVRHHLREKLRSARELILAIAQRQATLLRVAEAVMTRQRDFLRRGRSALRPLSMAAVAADLGLHASTVSRAIAGKYASTPQGTFRLRDFFDGGGDGTGGSGTGRGAVAQRIADLVAKEDRSNPLSDDAIAAALAARGVVLARRTVTKFRRELGIPPSHRRRRYGSHS